MSLVWFSSPAPKHRASVSRMSSRGLRLALRMAANDVRVWRTSFRVLLQLLLTAMNRQRVVIPTPFALAEMQAGLLELLPNPLLTRDQVRLLKTDKVVSGLDSTLGDLGVQPRGTLGVTCGSQGQVRLISISDSRLDGASVFANTQVSELA
jgi:hypothetical protein